MKKETMQNLYSILFFAIILSTSILLLVQCHENHNVELNNKQYKHYKDSLEIEKLYRQIQYFDKLLMVK